MIAAIGLVMQVAGYTYYVTPNGSGTSNCLPADPCNLARMALLVSPGSSVLVQTGVYSQNHVELKVNGTVQQPIRIVFEEGAKLSGTRLKIPESSWSLVPGKAYTYQAVLDEANTFTASMAAQRDPANWRRILVDDRVPPFTSSLGRPFYLEFPILYRSHTNVDLVEMQSCSMRHDTSLNRVFVHMCHDGPPKDEDNLYISSGGWGQLSVTGDYYVIEGLTVEHAGFRVNTASFGTVIKRFTARASWVWIEGENTVAEDLDISHYIKPGLPTHSQCYDANPDFGRGECWNASGEGYGILIGRQGTTRNYNQTVRRAFVHRNWNLGRVDGPNTLEDSTFWGSPNHSILASGNNVVIRGNTFHASQDALYMSRDPFDNLIVENNLFYNSVMVGTSNWDTGAPGVPPTKWVFRNNVVTVFVADDVATPSLEGTCNVYIPTGAGSNYQFKIIGTAGKPTKQWVLSAAQSMGYEKGSYILPYSKWYDGTLFTQFTRQSDPNFNFTLVDPRGLFVCAPSAGPQRLLQQPDSESQFSEH